LGTTSRLSGLRTSKVSICHANVEHGRNTYDVAVRFHLRVPSIPPSTSFSKQLNEGGIKIRIRKALPRRSNKRNTNWAVQGPSGLTGPVPATVFGTQHLQYPTYCQDGLQNPMVNHGTDINGRVTMHQRQQPFPVTLASPTSVGQPAWIYQRQQPLPTATVAKESAGHPNWMHEQYPQFPTTVSPAEQVIQPAWTALQQSTLPATPPSDNQFAQLLSGPNFAPASSGYATAAMGPQMLSPAGNQVSQYDPLVTYWAGEADIDQFFRNEPPVRYGR
jgi:hypothetical protein